MSGFDYIRSRATAERLITRFGAQAAIYRHVDETSIAPPGRSWDPHSSDGRGSRQEIVGSTMAVRLEYSSREVDGTEILSSDAKIYTSAAPGRAAPKTGDSLVLADGSSYEVISCDPLIPADVIVMYVVQGRS